MVPPTIWKIPNAVITTLAIMVAFPFWATSQLQYANYYQEVGKWPATRVAVSMLPQGIVAVTIGFAIRFIPFVVEKPRLTIGSGSLCESYYSSFDEMLNRSDYRRLHPLDLFQRRPWFQLLDVLPPRLQYRFSRRHDRILCFQVSSLLSTHGHY
jgi:hypothetical protein